MARKRGNRWITDVRMPDGNRLRYGFPTESAAVLWEEAARKAILAGRPVPDPQAGLGVGRTTGTKLDTLGGLYDFVVKTVWSQSRSPASAIRNGRYVVEYLGRNIHPSEVGHIEIEEMRAEFLSRGSSPATVNRRIAALSKMLRTAEMAHVIDRAPKMTWNHEKKTKFRFLDQKEEEVLLAYWRAAGQEDLHDLTVFLLDTGARTFTEALPAKWGDFGPDLKSVTFWNTKSGHPRTVPITGRLQEILKSRKAEHPRSSGPFMGMKHGWHMNENSLRSKWDTMRQSLPAFHDVTPHTLRHTCCTRLVLGGVDVKRVMTWMGHSAIVTTLRYMQIREKSLEEVLHVLEGPSA